MAKIFRLIKLQQSIKTMKITFTFTICLFIAGNNASSDFKDDATVILRVLQKKINNMNLLSKCYSTAYQVNGTIKDKRECLAIFAKLSKPRNDRRSSLRGSNKATHYATYPATQMKSRHKCRRFYRGAC